EKVGFIDLLQKMGPKDHQFLYVLTYHRVEELDQTPWMDPGYISTTPQQFEEQMKLIVKKYHPVSAEQILEAAHGGKPLLRDSVLVTVDDGYRSYKDVIFPICAKYGIIPLLFLSTGFVGEGTFWWDKVFQIIHLSGRNEIETPFGKFSLSTNDEKEAAQHTILQALKKTPFDQAMAWVDSTHSSLVNLSEEKQQNTVTWDDLRQLIGEGATIASHTHTHPMMTQIPLEEARYQVRLSQEIIRRELGYAPPIFAFPDGKNRAFNQNLIDMLYSEGFEMLFLLVDGRAVIQPGRKNFTLPRIAVWQNQTIPHFHLRLTPIIDRLKK
ncbi:MAG TPA: polysaccharide deacetylase family protein, partial [Leptolinea sp.]